MEDRSRVERVSPASNSSSSNSNSNSGNNSMTMVIPAMVIPSRILQAVTLNCLLNFPKVKQTG